MSAAAEDLTLEKLKIEERLRGVEQSLTTLVTLKESEDKHFEQLLMRMSKTLYGNGHEGLTTTVSNHTQSLRVVTGLMWAMATVLISLGMKAVWDKLVMGIG